VNLSLWSLRQIMTSLCIAQGLSRDYLDQPKWSAMREASYGHATLDFESATAATFRWHRNQVQTQQLLVLRHSCSLSTAQLILYTVVCKVGVLQVLQPCVLRN
jgi:Iron/zinc purple acid phosphatase-like protein C